MAAPTTRDWDHGTGDRSAEPQTPVPDPQHPLCSRELCGGIHVGRTGEIGYFRIVGESSVAGGVRRIEALTGVGAEAWADAQAAAVRDIAARLGAPPAQALERVEGLLLDLKQRQQELDALRSQSARGALDGLGQVQQQNGVSFLAARVDATDAAQLREMGDWLRDKLGSGVVVLGAALSDKPQIWRSSRPIWSSSATTPATWSRRWPRSWAAAAAAGRIWPRPAD